jgi:hypothetical protein
MPTLGARSSKFKASCQGWRGGEVMKTRKLRDRELLRELQEYVSRLRARTGVPWKIKEGPYVVVREVGRVGGWPRAVIGTSTQTRRVWKYFRWQWDGVRGKRRFVI